MTDARKSLSTVLVIVVGICMVVALGPLHQKSPGHSDDEPQQSTPPLSAENLVQLEIELGINQKQQTFWSGELHVSPGRVLSTEVVRGGRNATTDRDSFRVQHRMAGRLLTPILRVTLDAPSSAKLRVTANDGVVACQLAELAQDVAKKFLDDQVAITRRMPTLRLTGPATEDDYPAMARAPDGSVWLAYVEYKSGQPVDMKAVTERRFDSLVTRGNGDRIRLMRFDGQAWHEPVNVTSEELDVWRPTIAVDGHGNVVVAWAQAVDGDWEIFFRRYTPATAQDSDPTQADRAAGDRNGRWSDIVRVTNAPGADFHVVATTDASGQVWFAWQGWRKDNFDIHVASVEMDQQVKIYPKIPNTRSNQWSPAIAADTGGNVFVAWDSYDNGNYDVDLHVIGQKSRDISVAESARFEARPHLACDRDGRLWIAYEEGDQQWGKDFSMPVEWGRNRGEVDPGFGLYVHRSIKVKVLDGERLLQPAQTFAEFSADQLPGNSSLPRLAIDGVGGVWLLLRRHLQPGARSGGEAWHSFALRYDGQRWSRPQQLPQSSNLLDNRPALTSLPEGVLAVYSSDTRQRTQNRDQNDLMATMLASIGPASPPNLVEVQEPDEVVLPAVHPNETADVARMRQFRIRIGGKTLRLLRGDFHRHTEYTAHRDGDGLLEDMWRYALDAGRLDWLGNGDHDNGYGHEYHWWQIQKVTDLFHHPPYFVAAQTYERSNRFPDGHRNVIMPRRGIRPLPRGSLKGTPEEGTPDTKLLYDYLKRFGGMCAAHTSGTNMGTDWRDNDPDVEPVVEIFQGCRQEYQSYEHLGAPRAAPQGAQAARFDPGYVWNALAKGYRLGFQSSSDHLSTHISYAVVLAEDGSRQAIIDAFKKRHCYGANDNILLIVRSGEWLMGDVFETSELPALEMFVHAVKPIAKLHVIRNNEYVLHVRAAENAIRRQIHRHECLDRPVVLLLCPH